MNQGYTLDELIIAAKRANSMNSEELDHFVRVCSNQDIVLKFHQTGKLNPDNQWFKSCQQIIAVNQERVLKKIGFKIEDLDLDIIIKEGGAQTSKPLKEMK